MLQINIINISSNHLIKVEVGGGGASWMTGVGNCDYKFKYYYSLGLQFLYEIDTQFLLKFVSIQLWYSIMRHFNLSNKDGKYIH